MKFFNLTILLLLIPFLTISQTQIGQDFYGVAPDDSLGTGLSISSDGNIVAIGAPYNNDNGFHLGQVRVFENINNVWTQKGQTLFGEALGYGFGGYVSLSSDGSIVAISNRGSWLNGIGNSYVSVFKNINNII